MPDAAQEQAEGEQPPGRIEEHERHRPDEDDATPGPHDLSSPDAVRELAGDRHRHHRAEALHAEDQSVSTR